MHFFSQDNFELKSNTQIQQTAIETNFNDTFFYTNTEIRFFRTHYVFL